MERPVVRINMELIYYFIKLKNSQNQSVTIIQY
jgi:hypothetical protein